MSFITSHCYVLSTYQGNTPPDFFLFTVQVHILMS